MSTWMDMVMSSPVRDQLRAPDPVRDDLFLAGWRDFTRFKNLSLPRYPGTTRQLSRAAYPNPFQYRQVEADRTLGGTVVRAYVALPADLYWLSGSVAFPLLSSWKWGGVNSFELGDPQRAPIGALIVWQRPDNVAFSAYTVTVKRNGATVATFTSAYEGTETREEWVSFSAPFDANAAVENSYTVTSTAAAGMAFHTVYGAVLTDGRFFLKGLPSGYVAQSLCPWINQEDGSADYSTRKGPGRYVLGNSAQAPDVWAPMAYATSGSTPTHAAQNSSPGEVLSAVVPYGANQIAMAQEGHGKLVQIASASWAFSAAAPAMTYVFLGAGTFNVKLRINRPHLYNDLPWTLEIGTAGDAPFVPGATNSVLASGTFAKTTEPPSWFLQAIPATQTASVTIPAGGAWLAVVFGGVADHFSVSADLRITADVEPTFGGAWPWDVAILDPTGVAVQDVLPGGVHPSAVRSWFVDNNRVLPPSGSTVSYDFPVDTYRSLPWNAVSVQWEGVTADAVFFESRVTVGASVGPWKAARCDQPGKLGGTVCADTTFPAELVYAAYPRGGVVTGYTAPGIWVGSSQNASGVDYLGWNANLFRIELRKTEFSLPAAVVLAAGSNALPIPTVAVGGASRKCPRVATYTAAVAGKLTVVFRITKAASIPDVVNRAAFGQEARPLPFLLQRSAGAIRSGFSESGQVSTFPASPLVPVVGLFSDIRAAYPTNFSIPGGVPPYLFRIGCILSLTPAAVAAYVGTPWAGKAGMLAITDLPRTSATVTRSVGPLTNWQFFEVPVGSYFLDVSASPVVDRYDRVADLVANPSGWRKALYTEGWEWTETVSMVAAEAVTFRLALGEVGDGLALRDVIGAPLTDVDHAVTATVTFVPS